MNPEPSLNLIPDWYRDSSIFIKNKIDIQGEQVHDFAGVITKQTNFTIKKCMPVFDTITAGYMLKIGEDINIYQSKTNPNDENYRTHIAWTDKSPVTAHNIEQIDTYPHSGVHVAGLPKFVNYWVIKTPPGYSCLFITPMHRGLPFTIMPGIVDTDTFDHPVSFPFMINEKGFEGVLKAGTPMVQIIPFKRDEFSLDIYSSVEEYRKKNTDTNVGSTMFPESYKKASWHKKFFK